MRKQNTKTTYGKQTDKNKLQHASNDKDFNAF